MSETVHQKSFRQSVFMVLLKNLIIDHGTVNISYNSRYPAEGWQIEVPTQDQVTNGVTLEKTIAAAWSEAVSKEDDDV
ncbi:MAG: hypothetical protein CL398_11705 [Acidiferrobacteraceae bacterium]|nr:hypothetical protein [Acidiferrobacteraceae bacterium]|tara:strand:- start:792 stop:1025 length:234 start_codon:yes stop_codon:yes gene_type:complete